MQTKKVSECSCNLQEAQSDIDSQGRQMEHHNSKGKQLAQETRSLPQFEASIIPDDLDRVNKAWSNSGKVRNHCKAFVSVRSLASVVQRPWLVGSCHDGFQPRKTGVGSEKKDGAKNMVDFKVPVALKIAGRDVTTFHHRN